MGKLDGRIDVMTGAAIGNGERLARVLAIHSAHVALWDISEKVFETSKSLEAKGHKSTPF